jgi:hypothetical protein
VVDRLEDGSFKVSVAAPPEEGKANAELLRYLARMFGVANAKVRLVSGGTETRETRREPTTDRNWNHQAGDHRLIDHGERRSLDYRAFDWRSPTTSDVETSTKNLEPATAIAAITRLGRNEFILQIVFEHADLAVWAPKIRFYIVETNRPEHGRYNPRTPEVVDTNPVEGIVVFFDDIRHAAIRPHDPPRLGVDAGTVPSRQVIIVPATEQATAAGHACKQ